MQSRIAGAWALIIAGSIIFLNQLDLFDLNRATIISILCITGGIYLLIKGFNHPAYKGIFGGTFFTIFGASLFLMKIDYLPINDSFALGLILADLGIANLLYFMMSRTKISNLVFGLIFILTAIPFLASYFYYIPSWEIEDIFSTYWPILLILLGIGLLAESLLKYFRKNNQETRNTA
ncbi:MAG: DUF5668 domain-containing protein [Calditrichaceae bacterium]|jgi:hypothetical protein